MTITHIAWLEFNAGVSDERIEEHLSACRQLPRDVPAVVDLVCGPNQSVRAGGYTHGIVVTLPSMAALAEYLDHPAHVPVAARLKDDLAGLAVMDLEV